jgi:fatty acid desaturase
LSLAIVHRKIFEVSDILAKPQKAAAALWVMAAVNLLAAALLAWAALWSVRRARIATGLLGSWAVLSLLLALLLLAPATAYLGHGTLAMSTASVLLFLCVGAELLSTGLATATRISADRAQPTPI